ncbi:MAG: hypothetical protein IJK71_09725 [Clostridia bacterium]|nr:hypothetical protein [Clostridia bacterium]
METASLLIANYCVPCHSFCRYCLLASCGKATGVDYKAGEALGGRIIREMKDARPDLHCSYYIGYCMDTPDLPEFLRFSREYQAPVAKFLQMNGFAFREEPELAELMGSIRENGVELIDLTFYGLEEYHDRFAGRKGDFWFLLRMLDQAVKAGLQVNVSIPLIRENLSQIPELYEMLSTYPLRRCACFLPHSKGRGRTISEQRITKQEFEQLPEKIRNSFSRMKHRTEAEWIASGETAEFVKRSLILVLTPENFEKYNRMGAAETLAELEAMDDRYLQEMPPVQELARMYGDPQNQQLFRIRDLALIWQQRHIAETGNRIYDMHDETHSFSVHLREDELLINRMVVESENGRNKD